MLEDKISAISDTCMSLAEKPLNVLKLLNFLMMGDSGQTGLTFRFTYTVLAKLCFQCRGRSSTI